MTKAQDGDALFTKGRFERAIREYIVAINAASFGVIAILSFFLPGGLPFIPTRVHLAFFLFFSFLPFAANCAQAYYADRKALYILLAIINISIIIFYTMMFIIHAPFYASLITE